MMAIDLDDDGYYNDLGSDDDFHNVENLENFTLSFPQIWGNSLNISALFQPESSAQLSAPSILTQPFVFPECWTPKSALRLFPQAHFDFLMC